MNPFNGRFTHLSIDKAVRVIQAVVRNALLRVVRLSVAQLKKVVTIHHESLMRSDVLGLLTTQLGTVINHAMSQQVIELNERLGNFKNFLNVGSIVHNSLKINEILRGCPSKIILSTRLILRNKCLNIQL